MLHSQPGQGFVVMSFASVRIPLEYLLFALNTEIALRKDPKHSELIPRGGFRPGKDFSEPSTHVGEDNPSNVGGQAPSEHIGEDTPSGQGGQAPPQHIGEDAPSDVGGQASPQHIGEDSPGHQGFDSTSKPLSTNQSPNSPPAEPIQGFVSSEDLARKGRNVERVQDDAIKQHKKDKTYDSNDPDSYLPMDRRYKVLDDDPNLTAAESSSDSVNPIMEHPDIGLDPHVPWTYREILSKGQDVTKTTNIAMYSKNQKSIFAQSRYASYDKDPPPEDMIGTPGWKKGDPIPPRLPAGEILWQQYKDVAGDTAGELRFIVIHPVANENTNRVITEAHVAKKIPDNQKGTFTTADSNWDTLLGDIWHTFLGTDNVKGVPFITADHHNELGDKVVAKIHSWSPTRPGGIGMGAIVVELGPK